MEPTLDDVRQELADIHDELLAIPADDYTRRTDLRDRQNELRQLAAALIKGQALHDADALMAAYESLHKTRDKLLEKHMQFVSTEAGDMGIAGEITTTINRAMDAGMGVDEIESRLKEIIEQLRSSA